MIKVGDEYEYKKSSSDHTIVIEPFLLKENEEYLIVCSGRAQGKYEGVIS